MDKQRKHNKVWDGYDELYAIANSHAANIVVDLNLNPGENYLEEYYDKRFPELFCWIDYRYGSDGKLMWDIEINLVLYGL